jgi:hypothetical protein
MGLLKHPLLIFVISFAGLSLVAWIGTMQRLRRKQEQDVREYGIVENSTLTLLGLIIAFTFSMAIARFDQRKQWEATEANKIGTEYLRVSLLPATDAAKARALLVDYLDKRMAYYVTRSEEELAQIETETARLQAELWTAVQTPALSNPPNPVVALAVAGMNEVLDSQGYARAAWWNRIPTEAWGLMGAIALLANLLLGYTSKTFERERLLLMVMPFILSIAFFLIADIDSPRWGLIHVRPLNLESLAASLHAPAAKP